MTMTVEGPGGITIDFPDGTDQATINEAMRKAAGVGHAPGIGMGRQLDLTPGNDPLANAEDAATAYVGGVVSGVPVVGGLAENWINDLADHLASGITGKPYNEVKAHNDLVFHDINEKHPLARGAGEITGGLAGYGAIGAAAPALMGGGSLPLVTRSGIAAASNAGISGLDTAARGGDMGDIARSAAIGGGLGAAAPVVGAAIGAGARPLAKKVLNFFNPIPGMRRSAANTLSEALATDSAVKDVPTRIRELGPESMLVDAGPTLRGWGQAVATPPGPARSLVLNALKQREAGATDRILNDMDTAFGPAENPLAATRGLKAQRDLEHQALPQVFSQAPPVDIRTPLDTIGQGLNKAVGPEKAALQKTWEYLTEALPSGGRRAVDDAETLQNAKIAIDNLIDYGDAGLGVAPGALSKTQGALALVRRQLNEALRQQVPGYSDVMDRSAHLARQMNQIESGTQVLDSGKAALRPDELAAEMAGLSPEEQAAKRLGTRSDVDRIVRQNANDRIALKKVLGGEGDWNREKLGTMYGSPSADKALATADREATFFDTKHRIVDNSETAPRLEAARLADPTRGAPGITAATAVLGGPTGAVAYGGIRGIQKTWQAIQGSIRRGRNLDIAKALVERDPQTLAQALARRAGVSTTADRTAGKFDALARALIGYEGSLRKGEDLPPPNTVLPAIGVGLQGIRAVLP